MCFERAQELVIPLFANVFESWINRNILEKNGSDNNLLSEDYITQDVCVEDKNLWHKLLPKSKSMASWIDKSAWTGMAKQGKTFVDDVYGCNFDKLDSHIPDQDKCLTHEDCDAAIEAATRDLMNKHNEASVVGPAASEADEENEEDDSEDNMDVTSESESASVGSTESDKSQSVDCDSVETTGSLEEVNGDIGMNQEVNRVNNEPQGSRHTSTVVPNKVTVPTMDGRGMGVALPSRNNAW
uniref:Uncharacterized protein n=1 Tax=Pseudictyota dubia TaxID=2749911 RepID=A0A7R9WFE7_9STRA|mmetsp:Transcript_48503/g.89985  ORF Transcript_48503/g.89985 Transcript_48503/m.89985 type:complete len:241 (+) Transcript_48503:1980-2702(+)